MRQTLGTRNFAFCLHFNTSFDLIGVKKMQKRKQSNGNQTFPKPKYINQSILIVLEQ